MGDDDGPVYKKGIDGQYRQEHGFFNDPKASVKRSALTGEPEAARDWLGNQQHAADGTPLYESKGSSDDLAVAAGGAVLIVVLAGIAAAIYAAVRIILWWIPRLASSIEKDVVQRRLSWTSLGWGAPLLVLATVLILSPHGSGPSGTYVADGTGNTSNDSTTQPPAALVPNETPTHQQALTVQAPPDPTPTRTAPPLTVPSRAKLVALITAAGASTLPPIKVKAVGTIWVLYHYPLNGGIFAYWTCSQIQLAGVVGNSARIISVRYNAVSPESGSWTADGVEKQKNGVSEPYFSTMNACWHWIQVQMANQVEDPIKIP